MSGGMAPPRAGDGVVQRRALVIGIDDYLDPALRLPFCARDAHRVATTLAERGFDVTVLATPAAGAPAAAPAPTRARVRAAVDELAAISDDDDLAIVYVACHGVRVDGRPYLLCADTPAGAGAIAAGGLPLAELLERLRARARWVALFLDVCHIGLGLDPTVGASARHGADRAGGFALLAGSTSGDISQDGDDGGVFTRHLVEGLAGAAADPDGGVRLSALARHVQAGVARWRASPDGKRKLSRQRPVLRLEVADLQLVAARPFVELARHPAAITCATFTLDGLRLVTGCADGGVRLWDPRTAAQALPALAHTSAVRALACSRAGYLAAGGDDGVIRHWIAETGAPLPPDNQVGGAVHALAWSGTGLYRISGADDGLRVQHVKDIVLARMDARWSADPVRALALFAGGFVTGGADGALRWWAGETPNPVAIGAVKGPVVALAASPDGHHVAAVGGRAARAPTLWDLERGATTALGAHGAAVTAIAWSPDGARLATVAADGAVRVFAAPAGRLERTIAIDGDPRARPPAATCVAFAPDGRALFVGHADGRGRLHRIAP